MMRRHSFIFLVAVFQFSISVISAEVPKTKSDNKDERARELADRFMAAFRAKEIDAVMKLVDVPFYDEPGKPLVITDRDELQKHLKKMMPPEQDMKWVPERVLEVFAYGPERKKNKDENLEKSLKIQDEVFANEDRVVLVARAQSKEANRVIGVRFRDGKAFICAWYK